MRLLAHRAWLIDLGDSLLQIYRRRLYPGHGSAQEIYHFNTNHNFYGANNAKAMDWTLFLINA